VNQVQLVNQVEQVEQVNQVQLVNQVEQVEQVNQVQLVNQVEQVNQVELVNCLQITGHSLQITLHWSRIILQTN